MIIKIATGKDQNGNIQWTHLYSTAIRNRLRKDLNLADIPDTAEARKNLGIEAYIGQITDSLFADLKKYVDQQDLSFDSAVRTYIANNIETKLTNHETRITTIEKNMLTEEDVNRIFNALWNAKIPGVKQELKNYSDANLVTAKGYSDTNLATAKEHSNVNLETAKEYSDANLETAKNYSDANLTTAKGYTDSEVGKLRTELSGQIAALKSAVKSRIETVNRNFSDISKDLDGIYEAAYVTTTKLTGEIQKTNTSMSIINDTLDFTGKELHEIHQPSASQVAYYNKNASDLESNRRRNITGTKPTEPRSSLYKITILPALS